MWSDEAFEDEQVGWKHRLTHVVIGVALLGGLCTAIWFIAVGMSKTERHAIQTVTRISLPPPPVTPPPPKPPEPEKVVETPKIQEPKLADKKPDKVPPKPQTPPASPLTAEAGTGANPYGLAVGNGSGNVIGGAGDGSAGLAYQSYARTVMADVQTALRNDERLRSAKFTMELHIWLDAAGKVVRVQLASSSGDPAVDTAVTRTLSELAIPQPPPRDMPQPIRLRTKSVPG
jgi:periplasmic protein TonB